MSEDRSDEDILKEARERFKRAQVASHDDRMDYTEAVRFRALEQWPEDVKRSRENDPDGARLCLVVDKVNQYIRQIINDERQNRPAIKIRPASQDAMEEVAEAEQDLIRNIEYQSRADIAYDNGFESGVTGGFGYWRILTDYVDDSSLDQDIRIARIFNPLSVYMDPDRREPDGSDSKWCFITDWEDKDNYGKEEILDWEIGAEGDDDTAEWMEDDKVRIAEYFYLNPVSYKLVQLSDGKIMREDELAAYSEQYMAANPMIPLTVIRERDVETNEVKWCKLAGGQKILEKRDWPGKFIPVVEVIGNEYMLDGKRRLIGAVKQAMDAQRIYNFAATAFVETVALSPKAPYIAAEEQVEDYLEEWQDANRRNISVLRYKPVSEAGQALPPPQRQPQATVPSGWVAVMQSMEHDIQAALGMYAASVGAESNEKSGRAIMARQREGDTATFHYIDNLSRSITFTGKILLDLIPKVYDTKRVLRILGEDGTTDVMPIDPGMKEAMREYRDEQNAVKRIYNPSVGKYDVVVVTGPAYTTKRQEAVEAQMQMVQAAPNLMPIIGDLLVRNMDWPGADKIADRLKTLLPPQIQQMENDQSPIPPEAQAHIQQMQQVIQQGSMQLQALQQQMQQLQAENQTLTAKASSNQTQMVKAENDRRIAELNAAIKQEELVLSAQELDLKRLEISAELEKLNIQRDTTLAKAAAQQQSAQVYQSDQSMGQIMSAIEQLFGEVNMMKQPRNVKKTGTASKNPDGTWTLVSEELHS